ncbi:MAG: Zn-dependent hydrolase [Chloroflexi bacterium]|jgi:glyoxylase-like metal-dependent hydrolase (beta-lactamase superfamily II)|nr:Zn-dependent hydrolase [Chloroflexota bacterium]MCH2536398.1 MBL fold metallo-hydrolase [Dehalococcoidia bacterium]MEE2927601.1 MBL fold metallo-hydrolase [Chloroflexota bacterium]HIB10355.1 MBL fold metallo-hydrolase [Dehalococcoidia bacterium]HIM47384.1 MBL fold metallo-hydrolase [Dehalococcoidia bacterium]|tara:strand:- start:808 stop:1443 length:636 start_codon:yes stop_codon:yes gene_type:complete
MPFHYDGELKITKINMGPYNNNGYIVICPETNEGVIIDTPAEPEKLLGAIGDVQIKSILITHKHQDHLLGFDEITGAVQVPVGIGTDDADGLPRPPQLDLKDGMVIKFGNQEMTVLDTPGHTEGATCFLIGKHLFSGDTLFPGGPGKTRSPEALQQVIDSITKKLLVLPDDTAVYPGHGDDTTIGKAREEYQVFASKPRDPALFGDVAWLG